MSHTLRACGCRGEGAARVNLPSSGAPGGGGIQGLSLHVLHQEKRPQPFSVSYTVSACVCSGLGLRTAWSQGGTRPRLELFLWLQFKHDQCQ